MPDLHLQPIDILNPVFYAVFDRIAPAANKYMATLFNTSATYVLQVERIYRCNWQTTDIAQNDLEQYLARITARTIGTNVTIRSEDTTDVIPTGVVADTNSTAVTETNIRFRFFSWNDVPFKAEKEFGIAHVLAYLPRDCVIYERSQKMKGIILRQDQGITIRNVTSDTAGSVSYVFEFTRVFV